MQTAKAQSATEQLTRDIEELSSQLAATEAEYGRCDDQISEKFAEQRALMIAARVQKNKGAQAQVDRLTTEIRVMQDANLQNYAAIEELKAAVDAKRRALDREERRVRYGRVLALVELRTDAKLEARLLELAEELNSVNEQLLASDAEISAALRGLGGDFIREAMEVPYRERNCRNAVTELLLKDNAIDLRGGGWTGNPPADAAAAYKKLVQMLREVVNVPAEQAA